MHIPFLEACVRIKLQDYRGAIVDFIKVIELDPDNWLAYSDRGNAKYNLRDYQGAIIDFFKSY
ncbi:MAG: tetratricopeptide repeat protein [Bacteroidetes bacterium]|nr:tetratricopeptide repeat protein [Bacteroidota bacterium]